MTWQPLKRVPDPTELAVHDAMRATVLPLDTYAGVRRDEDEGLIVSLPDGQEVRVRLTILAQTALSFGPREAVRYDLEGHAVVGKEGLGLAGQATLDIKTRAFLDVTCDILWRTRDGVRV